MQVKEVMTANPGCCTPDSPLPEVAKLMVDHDCGAIPVVGPDGRIAGIVTDRDICMAALFQGRPLREVSVSEAMAHDVVTCHADDSLLEAEHLLSARQVQAQAAGRGNSGRLPPLLLPAADAVQVLRCRVV